VIASKFGHLRAPDGSPTSDGRPEYVKACCERSLKWLETDVIDLYYIHRVDPTVPIEDTVGAMSDLLRQGKVRHLGICEAGAATIQRAHATYPLSAVQIEYSLVDPRCGSRDPAALRGARHWLCRLQPGWPRFPDRQGRRRGASGGRRTAQHATVSGRNLRRNLALVEELKAHAAAENCTPAQLALAWVLSRAPYIVPIPGTSHRHRLEENAAAVSLKISADTEDALPQVFAPGAASGLHYPENHLARLGI
jgi:aryl-alcohol dehydrogenase-like predicted oxidoreductase